MAEDLFFYVARKDGISCTSKGLALVKSAGSTFIEIRGQITCLMTHLGK